MASCCRWLLLLKGSLAPIAGLDASASAMHAYAVSASDAALDATQMYLRLLQVPDVVSHNLTVWICIARGPALGSETLRACGRSFYMTSACVTPLTHT